MDDQNSDNFISPKGKVSDFKNYAVEVARENYGDSVTLS
jgi:hypothetical protein